MRNQKQNLQDDDNLDVDPSLGGADAASDGGPGGMDDLNAALAPDGGSEFFVGEEKPAANKSWMVLAFLVALGGAALYVMHLRTGPKPAAAAVESQQANKTITSFLEGGESNIRMMEQALNETERVVRRFVEYPNANQVPLADLRTNPFRLLLQRDPVNTSEIATRKRAEEERQAVIRSVQTLRLQSVMSGAGSRSCMINNTLYREGQNVEGFTVEKISAGSVIVKQGQYRFELRMQQ